MFVDFNYWNIWMECLNMTIFLMIQLNETYFNNEDYRNHIMVKLWVWRFGEVCDTISTWMESPMEIINEDYWRFMIHTCECGLLDAFS